MGNEKKEVRREEVPLRLKVTKKIKKK